MKILLQRVCWNTHGWESPSGSTFEDAFSGEEGYGGEEWNFNLTDEYDGFVFPYTYIKPNVERIGGIGEAFKIVFFTKNPATNQWLIVGVHHEVYLLEESDNINIFENFKSQGIIARRVDEMILACEYSDKEAYEAVSNSFLKNWIKVKSVANKVEFYDVPVVIEKPPNNRFTTFTYIKEIPKSSSNTDVMASGLCEDGYLRASSESLRNIIPRHNALSNRFVKYLKSLKIEVKQENNFVDVTFSIEEIIYLAELKVVINSTTRHSIREALGQVLEYNLYPGRMRADKWLIVLDSIPKENDKLFVKKLRDTLDLPVILSWEVEGDFQFDVPLK